MLKFGSTLLFALVAYLLYCLWCLWRNVQAAKRTGIAYVVVQRYNYNFFNALIARYLMRLVTWIDPDERYSPGSGRQVVKINWPWTLRYAPFKELGTDTFFNVSPGGLILNTADADVISQVTTRYLDFPKPTANYRSINIYGQNIVSSEGAQWRHHRKATGFAFTESTNRLVWKETLEQAGDMLKSWTKRDEMIPSVAPDTMRLSLHVMSRAALGERMAWPTLSAGGIASQNTSVAAGHTMNFTDCLVSLLKNLLYLMIFPHWMLKNSPRKAMQETYSAYREFGRYMQEMVDSKRAAKSSATTDNNTATDLISQLAKQTSSTTNEKDSSSGLTDSEVIGNLFVFIIAGHETSASSIHFSLIMLALNPSVQRRVQQELDTIFGTRSPSTWSYDSDLPRLQTSLLQAVLNEQLRIIAPIVGVGKIVSAEKPQSLEIGGKTHTIPAGTMIRLCVPSVHRNPKYWPAGPPKDPKKPFHPPCDPDNDLEEFKPERWIVDPAGKSSSTSPESKDNSSAKGDPATPSHTLLQPPRGSYIPFSLASRACLGQRFANVEILAALASILHSHTIELAVPEMDADDGKAWEKMDQEEKRECWERVRDKGNWTWQNKCGVVITLQMRGAGVPVWVRRRGEERVGEEVWG